jgi:hypothetical protein
MIMEDEYKRFWIVDWKRLILNPIPSALKLGPHYVGFRGTSDLCP